MGSGVSRLTMNIPKNKNTHKRGDLLMVLLIRIQKTTGIRSETVCIQNKKTKNKKEGRMHERKV